MTTYNFLQYKTKIQPNQVYKVVMVLAQGVTITDVKCTTETWNPITSVPSA